MIDVNKITSTLAKLPDAQLQQYAQMHKADPYIMALAMSESNRRKEMRAAGQGAQGMQEQPKVVDQMVAEMAPQQQAQPMPEDQGIGQLPAGEMNFANGGIIAFADGGGVERYSGAQGSLTGGSIFDQMDQQKASQLAQLNSQLAMVEPQLRAAAASGDPQAIQTYAQQAQAIRNQITAMRESTGNRVGVIDKLAAAPLAAAPLATAPAADAGVRRMSPSEIDKLKQDPYAMGTPAPLPLVDPRKKALAEPRRETKPGAGLGAAADPTAKTDTGGLDSLISKFTRDTDFAIGEGRNARVGLAAALEQTPKNRAARNELARKDEGDAFKGREDRLAARERGLEGMGDKNMGLALLQAGAAMMSTPGALSTALGKGIAVGSERYIAGLDKINAAKDRFADARDRLDDLRTNRSDMTKKEIREEQRDIDNGVLQAKKLFADGLDNDLKITAANQKAIFGVVADDFKTTKTLDADAKKTDKLLAGRLDEARILAAARATAKTELTANERAALADKAVDNVENSLKSDSKLALEISKNPARKQELITAETNRLLAAAAGLSTMVPPPGASSAGGTRPSLDSFQR